MRYLLTVILAMVLLVGCSTPETVKFVPTDSKNAINTGINLLQENSSNINAAIEHFIVAIYGMEILERFFAPEKTYSYNKDEAMVRMSRAEEDVERLMFWRLILNELKKLKDNAKNPFGLFFSQLLGGGMTTDIIGLILSTVLGIKVGPPLARGTYNFVRRKKVGEKVEEKKV